MSEKKLYGEWISVADFKNLGVMPGSFSLQAGVAFQPDVEFSEDGTKMRAVLIPDKPLPRP